MTRRFDDTLQKCPSCGYMDTRMLPASEECGSRFRRR